MHIMQLVHMWSSQFFRVAQSFLLIHEKMNHAGRILLSSIWEMENRAVGRYFHLSEVYPPPPHLGSGVKVI
jgi:hypothetical protein